MSKTSIFYVYVDRCLDSQAPFYVGKGTLRRTRDFTRHNRKWNSIVNKRNIHREIVFETTDEQLALFEEARLIFELKTRDYLGGANLDDGGKGPNGYKHTLPVKEILSNLSRIRANTPEERIKASEKFEKMWKEKRDKLMKTHIRGTFHPKSKLKESDILLIRKLYDELDKTIRGTISNFMKSWSKTLGVTPENIFRIVHRKSWTHI